MNNLEKLQAYLDGKLKVEEIQSIMEEGARNYYYSDKLSIPNDLYDKVKRKLSSEGITIAGEPSGSNRDLNLKHTFNQLACTLKDVTSIDEVKNWIRKLSNLKPTACIDNINLGCSMKLDGNSVTLNYNAKTGILINAVTRGENGYGMDLTRVFNDHKLPEILLYDNDIEDIIGVKYEAIITYDNLKKLNALGGRTYVNPRSAISGILGKIDAELFKEFISLIPLEIRFTDNENLVYDRETQLHFIDELVKNDKSGKTLFFYHEILPVSELITLFNDVQKERSTLEYMIDGIVVELLDPHDREKAGWVGDSMPNYAVALKFPYQEAFTEIIGFEYDFGYKTGRITPCVRLKPVIINGCTFDRVSLANYKRFTTEKFSIGETVLFQYRMDCLGYVDKINHGRKDLIPEKFIEKCPICNSDLVFPYNDDNEQVYAYCHNEDCLGNRIGFFTRLFEEVGVKGTSEKTFIALYEAGVLSDLQSLFTLTKQDILKVQGFSNKSADNLLLSIKRLSNIKDHELLASLPLESIGTDKSKILCEEFGFDNIIKATSSSSEDLRLLLESKKVNGIAKKSIDSLVEELPLYIDMINDLLDKYIKVSDTSLANNPKVNKSNGKKICITGSVSYSGGQVALEKMLEGLGYKIVGSVSSKTDMLICNTPSSSTKYLKAKELNIPILTEIDFISNIGLS